MSELRVTLVQTSLFWEDKQANLQHFEKLLAGITDPTDVVVLPEMFTTGFSMDTSLAETMDGPCVNWMRHQSKQLGAAVGGSLMVAENGLFYNRFVWMNPDGMSSFYNKRHLFRLGNESDHFTAGTEPCVVTYKDWNLQLLVCYDLRFPVWMRRTPNNEYDAIVIAANWPEPRVAHWRTLLQARAIENQCYVVAVNRVGLDGKGMNHTGSSGLISPKGEWVNDLADGPQVVTVVLHKQEVTDWRSAFPTANDADSFTLA
jgi:predicted amidohydrolase